MLNNDDLEFNFDDVIPTKEQIIKYASLAKVIKEKDCVYFGDEANEKTELLLSELSALGYNPEAIMDILEALMLTKIFNTAQEVVELEDSTNED